MSFQLVVLKPFRGFKKGELIKDPVAVNSILAGPEASFVVRVVVEKES